MANDIIIRGRDDWNVGDSFVFSYSWNGTGNDKHFQNSYQTAPVSVPEDANVEHPRMCVWLELFDNYEGDYHQYNYSYNYLKNNGDVGFFLLTSNTVEDRASWGDETTNLDTNGQLIGNFYMFYPYFLGCYFQELNYIFNFQVPVFASQAEARQYCLTGDDSGRIDTGSQPSMEEITDFIYYIQGWTYKVTPRTEAREELSRARLRVRIPSDANIAGYINNNVPYNIHLITNASKMYAIVGDGEEWESKTALPLNDAWTYTDTISDGEYEYYGFLNRNIKIFDSRDKAEQFLEDGEGDGESGGEAGSGAPPNRTGDDTGDQTDDIGLQRVGSVGFTHTHVLNTSAINRVAALFYNESTDIVEQIEEGLTYYGQNPIEALIDLYWLPIDITEFYDTFNQSHIMFGNYNMTTEEHPVLYTGGKMKTLVNNAPVFETYGDWRDYETMTAELYLPFVGIVSLDTPTFINRVLDIKCTFDAHAHTIKYYIFSGDRLVQTHEGSLGVTFPIMSTDIAGKASQNIQAISGLVSDSISLTSSAVGIPKGTKKNPVTASQRINYELGLFSDVSNVASDVASLVPMSAKRAVTGNYSSALGCYDILYPYLIIRTQRTVKPKNLKAKYGMPCNKVVTIGSCSGYTVVDNPHIEVEATEAELDEINALLAQGVIV